MKKRVLVSDWGQVIIRVDHSAFDRNTLPESRSKLLEIIDKLDRGLVAHYKALDEINDCFKKPMGLCEFEKKFLDSWVNINYPLYSLYKRLKNNGVKLAAITDIADLSLYYIRKRFPSLIDLFTWRKGGHGKPQECIVASCEEQALKLDRKPFISAMRRFNFGPQEAVFVDNEKYNRDIAEDLGFTVLPYEIKSAFSHALLEQNLKLLFPQCL